MTTTSNPFGRLGETPLADWERELLDAGMPAPVQTRVWTAESTGLTERTQRGRNVEPRMVTDVDGDTPTPSARHWIPTLPAGKAHRQTQPWRLTDGERHPVTTRRIGDPR